MRASVTDSGSSILLALGGGVLVGVLTASQSRINGELSARIGDGYIAAVISFGSGLLILLAILAFSAQGRSGVRRVASALRFRRIPWWYVCGGAAGALFVLSQGLTAGVLGVALFTVAVVSGQTVSGLVVDRMGLGTMAPAAVTFTRLAGSVLALLAVGWAVSAQIREDIPLWMLILPLLAGIGLGWQQAVNGQVRVVAQSALTATLTNFVAGTLVLTAAALLHAAFTGWPSALPPQPWLYSGGAIGAVFIGLGVVVVKRTGVLLLGLSAVAGQLLTSLVLDLTLPVAGHRIVWTTVLGTVLTLMAVCIAAIPSRAVGRGPGRATPNPPA